MSKVKSSSFFEKYFAIFENGQKKMSKIEKPKILFGKFCKF